MTVVVIVLVVALVLILALIDGQMRADRIRQSVAIDKAADKYVRTVTDTDPL